MNTLEKIKEALGGVGIQIEAGEYPVTDAECGKIVLTGKGKPAFSLGGGNIIATETFQIILRGSSFLTLESKAQEIKNKLTAAVSPDRAFLQTGSFEQLPLKDGGKPELAVSYKIIQEETEN